MEYILVETGSSDNINFIEQINPYFKQQPFMQRFYFTVVQRTDDNDCYRLLYARNYHVNIRSTTTDHFTL